MKLSLAVGKGNQRGKSYKEMDADGTMDSDGSFLFRNVAGNDDR
jgi:hypothetical protein